jgi:hypothetical protein
MMLPARFVIALVVYPLQQHHVLFCVCSIVRAHAQVSADGGHARMARAPW